MKRCISMIIALGVLLTCGTLAFAKSDFQFQLGYQHVTLDTDADGYGDSDIKTDGVTFNLENYNLFDIAPDVFSVGFVEGLRVGYDVGSKDDFDYYGVNIDFVIGPAIGFQVKDIVKFQGMIGLDIGCKMLRYDGDYISYFDDGSEVSTSDNKFYAGFEYGFATGIQAKFLPASFVSPVIGFRYAKTFTELDDEDCDVDTMNVYLGCSLNIGR